MDQPTTFTDIETSFHSMPLTKYGIIAVLLFCEVQYAKIQKYKRAYGLFAKTG